jgi:hypothetical protein
MKVVKGHFVSSFFSIPNTLKEKFMRPINQLMIFSTAKRFMLFAVLSLAALVMLPEHSASSASTFSPGEVRTNNFIYVKNDLVIITGAGWQPGEPITLTLTGEPAPHPQLTFQSIADSNGQFENTDFFAYALFPGENFVFVTVTATGQLSGTSTTIFRIGAVGTIYNSDCTTPANLSPTCTQIQNTGDCSTSTYQVCQPPAGTYCFKILGLSIPHQSNAHQIEWYKNGTLAHTSPASTLDEIQESLFLDSGDWQILVRRLSDNSIRYKSLVIRGVGTCQTYVGCSGECVFVPVFVCNFSACEQNIVASSTQGQCGAEVGYTYPTADCPAEVSCYPGSGTFFPIGTTTVNCLFNQSTKCNFTVTVNDTQPPAITCPQPIITQAAPGQCSAVVNFTVNATDNSCTAVNIVNTPPSGSSFAVGTTTVTSVATDSSGNSNVCTFDVTVRDTQAPTINCPANITQPADAGQCAAVVNYSVSSSDNCGTPTVSCNPSAGSSFPIGTTTVSCVANDAAGNRANCSFTVQVLDTQPPAINGISVNKPVLWTPDHSMVDVTVNYTASDNCGSSPVRCLLSVSSNEPINGTGDGDMAPDWLILDAHHIKLRAERAGTGNGRIYTISIRCTDSAGNASTGTVTVSVPKNQS